MWKNNEIQVLFALHGASPSVIEYVKENDVSHADMDNMTILKMTEMGVTSKNVASILITNWKGKYSQQLSQVALEEIEQAMELYNHIFTYKAESNVSKEDETNNKQEAVDTVRHADLLAIIHEQEKRIAELENREADFIAELEKRAELIQDQQAALSDLEKTTQAKSMTAEDIKSLITQHHNDFFKKIDETKNNVGSVDAHIQSILKMAQQTIDIIYEEEIANGNLDPEALRAGIRSRQVHIEQISVESLEAVSALKNKVEDDDDIGGVTFDPFVTFKLPGGKEMKTKTIPNSSFTPMWDELNIEVPAVDDEFDEDNNRLTIEVWDEFTMDVANELLCSGSIPFIHLDLINSRGPVSTSIDLFDMKGNFITTATVNINIVVGELLSSRIGFATEVSSYPPSVAALKMDQFVVDDPVYCNYGGEGHWLAGKITRMKKVRDRNVTTLLYEIEFKNGNVEVNVPSIRLRPVKVPKPPPKSASKGPASAESSDIKSSEEKQKEDATELELMFNSNNSELLAVLTEVHDKSNGTISSVCELDEWQKRLTQLLSDALKRYLEINAAAKKYSVFVNSLTEKIGNVDQFLQRLEVSERKCDELNASGDNLRSEIEDLRKRLSIMTGLRDTEIDKHHKTQHLLEQEKEVTLSCKKEIIELRTELDHLVEVVRRDMSNRITNKNVNEELYSLSSNLVKKEATPNGAPSPSPFTSASHNVSANDHDDIFMQQHDWKLYMSLIKMNMTSREVSEAHATLHNLQRSFEILSSRLLLECRHRSECEFKLSGAKEDLRDIRDKIIAEGTLRIQLQEEMQYFKEQAEQFKDEVEKHKKFSVIAKKAAYDAINQARFYQKKLSQEIDNISESGFGESKTSVNDQKSQGDGNGGDSIRKGSTPNKKKRLVDNFEDEFAGLFEDTTDDEEDTGNGRRRRKLTRSTTAPPKGNSPYLSNRNKNRNRAYNHLQTRSENEKDLHASASQTTYSSKKSKKIKVPGKKQMSYVGKKISRVLFDGKNGRGGVAPYDDSGGKSSQSPGKRPWKNPNFVDYAKKYGKEPPTAASRRAYYPGQQNYD
mmetsp:Transcript_29938/g.55531  ORF Transcript_29938/g.55531 Transcript_29938/m.55531 type:complete len:1059 (+) Transcript_29938:149-3325(+)